MSGFIEVLKRGVLERLKKEERLTKEVKLMERLMKILRFGIYKSLFTLMIFIPKII